jgi:MFS family permease
MVWMASYSRTSSFFERVELSERAADHIGRLQDRTRLLWIQFLNGLSQWLDIYLVFSVPSFLWSAAPSEIAVIALMFGLPGLAFGPLVGAALDRGCPAQFLFWGAICRALLTVAIAFAPTMAVFAVVVFLKGMANVAFWPATSVAANKLVAAQDRVSYFGAVSGLSQVSKILIPSAAGLMAAVLPMQLLFLCSASVTIGSLIPLSHLRRKLGRSDCKSQAPERSVYRELLAGVSVFKRFPAHLKFAAFASLGLALSVGLYDPHLAAFLASRGFSAQTYGFVVSATGFGAIAAAAVARGRLSEVDPHRIMRAGMMCFSAAVGTAAMVLAFVEKPRSVILVAMWAINGFGYELFVIGTTVVIQNLCPAELIGRATTSLRSLQLMCVLSGPSIGALLISAGSRVTPFVAAAVLTLVLAASALVLNRPRAVRPA